MKQTSSNSGILIRKNKDTTQATFEIPKIPKTLNHNFMAKFPINELEEAIKNKKLTNVNKKNKSITPLFTRKI